MKTYDLDPDKKEDSRIYVHDHPNTKNWQIRLRLPGERRYRKKSSGTEDLERAKAEAWKWLYELRAKKGVGIQLDGATFKEVAREYLEDLKRLVERGRRGRGAYEDYLPIVTRYFIPFFGLRQIDTITDADVDQYRSWRDDYWVSGPGSKDPYIRYVRNGRKLKRKMPQTAPSASRLRIEDVPLRQIFEFGNRKGWISLERMPKIESDKAVSNSRPAFTKDEIDKILNSLSLHVEAGHSDQIKLSRRLLGLYIQLVLYTGVRPGLETEDLQWRDIATEKDASGADVRVIKINARKPGKSQASRRTIVPRKQLWAALDAWKSDTKFSEPDSPIFCTADGKPIKSFKSSFKTFLRDLKLRTNWMGEEYTLYSLRHSYITLMLGQNVDVWKISKNTGNSPDVIRRFYSKDNPIDHSHALAGDGSGKFRQEQPVGKPIKEYTEAQWAKKSQKMKAKLEAKYTIVIVGGSLG